MANPQVVDLCLPPDREDTIDAFPTTRDAVADALAIPKMRRSREVEAETLRGVRV